MQNILCEIGVAVREGAAHIVALAAPRGDQLLKFRHNAVIAAVPGIVHAGCVVNLSTPVQTQHHVAHFAVGELDYFVIDKHPVGCQREAEVLAVLFLDRTGVGNDLFDDLPVHQRFAAEKIDLQVVPCP